MFFRINILLTLLLPVVSVFSQNNADEILGYYMSPQKNSIFKFYKSGDKYYAKSVWMKRPNRLDSLHPDPNKRNRKILGSLLAWGFVYDGDHAWNKGYIYDANTGKTYKAKITRDEKHNLSVRGYIGLQLIGKTEYFVKVDFKEHN